MKFETEDKKYKVVFNGDTGELVAYRYGEMWRNLCGDNLVLAMLSRINDLEEELGAYKHQEVIKLTNEGADNLLAVLENPPPVSDKLLKAAKKFKEEGFTYNSDM